MLKDLNRQDLLASFEQLNYKFSQALSEAQQQDVGFENIRNQFQNRLSKRLQEALESLPADSPLAQQVAGFISLIRMTSESWNKKISSRNKGLEFRSGFEDSLLVFVYGKVKSCKSSLGNYMAWGKTDPEQGDKEQVPIALQPIYFSHAESGVIGGDKHQEAAKRREFRVGATEATSSIQGFKLAGLTWVDSPGLHSVNRINEQLAKDYVEHADLILYTMKSDAPARASDLDEIRLLLKKNKKTLLLLTGSDDVEEDWDDKLDQVVSTVVMKDKERCAKQQQHVRKMLDELNLAETADIEIVSFSARYAQEHQNDPQAFACSGMGLLFSTIDSLISADGVRLKQQVPMTNFKNFLESCLEDLKPYHQLIEDFEKPISEVQKNIPRSVRREIRVVQDEIRAELHKRFDLMSDSRSSQEDVQKEIKRLQEDLDKKLEVLISASLERIFTSVIQDFHNSVVGTYRASDLVKLPNFEIETAEEIIPVGVSSGTRKRNSGIGSLLGGIAGLIIGGPAGAAIGATLGGAGGAMTGDDAREKTRTIQVTTGDNLHEIKRMAVDSYINGAEKLISEMADTLLTSSVSNAHILVEDLAKEIANIERSLLGLAEDVRNKLVLP